MLGRPHAPRRSPAVAGSRSRRPDGPSCRTQRRAGRSSATSTRCRCPAWDLVDMERYRRDLARAPRLLLAEHGHDARLPVPLQLVREAASGASATTSAARSTWSARSRWLKSSATRPDHIWFMDDIMGLKPGWIAALRRPRRAGGDRGIPLQVPDPRRPAAAGGTIEALRARRLRRSSGSAPSPGSQKVLDAMEKGTTVEQIREAARRAARRRHRGRLLPPVRLPGRDPRGRSSRRCSMVRDCRPDDIGMSVSYPLPGTPFHERVQASSWASKQNWVDSDDLAMMYEGPFTTAFYRQLHTRAPRRVPARARRGASCCASRGSRGGCGRATPFRRRGVLAPVARLPLAAAAARPARRRAAPGVGPLRPELSADEAARPSPQPESVERTPRRRPHGQRPAPDPRLLPVRGRARAGGDEALPAAGHPLPLVAPEGAAASRSRCSTPPSARCDAFARSSTRGRPAVVGIYANLMTRANVLRMIATCRDAGARSWCWAGRSRRTTPRSTCARGADVVVDRRGRGDARGAAAAPARAAASSGLERVRGHRLPRRRGGASCATPPRAAAAPTSTRQPWPDREAIDLDRYLRDVAGAPRLSARSR